MQTEILYSCFLRSAGLNTDTRTLQAGQMYLALKGENFNGNLFAGRALEMGAAFVVCDEKPDVTDKRILLVEDGLKALQDLARHHREVWGGRVIAVCGSNGKTTTKELITRALGAEKKVFATPGNLNNHIGVPLSLLRIQPEHELAVIEMGANHAGEIAELCEIARPDSGLITNIGKDHLEGFGSIENTAEANAELFDFLERNEGLAFINTSDEWNLRLQHRTLRQFTFPGETDDAFCRLLPSGFFLRIETAHGIAESRLTGKYNFHNLACALAVAKYYGIAEKNALEAVCSYEPGNNRSQLIDTGRNRIISDAYNANPSSVLAALENLAEVSSSQKWAVLGDMLELGADSEKEHAELGEWASAHPEIIFFVVGKEMQAFAAACPQARYFSEKVALEEFLKEENPSEKIILLKASRGMKLETLLPLL
jgi:UDP-N-acetylmuramoyl-tripeptide--D-alanyl-D-alanine ligase